MNNNNDLEALRGLLNDGPPSQEVRAAGRQELLETIKRSRHARPGRRRGIVWGPATAVAATIAIAAAITLTTDRDGPPPATGPHTAKTILLAAASKTEETGTREATSTGRYWMTRSRTMTIEQAGSPDDPYQVVATVREDVWTATAPGEASWSISQDLGARPATAEDAKAWRRDGSPSKLRPTGSDTRMSTKPGKIIRQKSDENDKIFALGSINISVHDLRNLSVDVDRLRAGLTELERQARDITDRPDRTNEHLYEAGVGMLLGMPITPKTRATTYRMLADLPGVKSLGMVTDSQGRTGQAVAMARKAFDGTIEDRLIIDPGTGHALAEEIRFIEPPPAKAWLKQGQLWYTDVVLERGWTDRPPP